MSERNMTNEEKTDLSKGRKHSLHHRIYPYMNELVQYANETENGEPWIVRDRSAALRNERTGRGRAVVRTWIPTDWVTVGVDDL